MKTVLVFGSFDGLHPGHLAMLGEAKMQGDKLVAALAPDGVIQRIKGRKPKKSFDDRLATLESSGLVNEVVASDETDGSYEILGRVKPDVVAFGYDQDAFRENFLKFLERTGKTVAVMTLSSFEPEKYKSSKIT